VIEDSRSFYDTLLDVAEADDTSVLRTAGPLFGGPLERAGSARLAARSDAKRHEGEARPPSVPLSLDTRNMCSKHDTDSTSASHSTKRFLFTGVQERLPWWAAAILPTVKREFRSRVRYWRHELIDVETGEVIDLGESLGLHAHHSVEAISYVAHEVGRGNKRHEETAEFRRPAGLPRIKENLFSGLCTGCRTYVEEGGGYLFPGDDWLRCVPCAEKIDPRIRMQRKRYPLPTLARRQAALRYYEGKRRRGGGPGVAKILAKETGMTEDDAAEILEAKLPRKTRRKANGRNADCPCGSGSKLKKCCGDSAEARGLGKRIAAKAAYVAQLNRVAKMAPYAERKRLTALAIKVWKCRRRWACAVCTKIGCAKHGQAEALAPVFSCGDRLCPMCSHQQAVRHADQIEKKLRAMGVDPRHVSHLVITCDNEPDIYLGPRGTWWYMRMVWWRVMELIAMKHPCKTCGGARRSQDTEEDEWGAAMASAEGVEPEASPRRKKHEAECQGCFGTGSVIKGGFRAIEATANEETCIHAHIGALIVHEEKIPQRDIQAAVLIATEGHGYVANIKRVAETGSWDDARRKIREVAKYDTKVLEVPDKFLIKLRDSLHRQHLKDGFGVLHGVKLDEEDEENVGEKTDEAMAPCDGCGEKRELVGVWLSGRALFKALRKSESVWPGWLNAEKQRSLPGHGAPPWRPPDET